MKKLRKWVAIFASIAIVVGGGILTSCYDGAPPPVEEDPTTDTKTDTTTPEEKASYEYDFSQLTSADAVKLGIAFSGSADLKIKPAGTYKLSNNATIVTTVAEKMTVKPTEGKPIAVGFNTNGVNLNGKTAIGETGTLDHYISFPVTKDKKYATTIKKSWMLR